MDSDAIRAMFSQAMSVMYRGEVPQYGTLIELVTAINRRVLRENPALSAAIGRAGERERLDEERHGAVRVGTPGELRLLRRLFAVMGMLPVGYYDLSAAGVPVHSTAFRAVAPGSLRRSPFRLFTSLLRLDLIKDGRLRAQASAILQQRRIVTDRATALVEIFEAEGRLDDAQAEEFVREALHTFRWHGDATVDAATYAALRAAHPLVADIVCFKGPHINHLTPRVLDIDAAQEAMRERGLEAKAQIEGPPRRRCPILLRQTSFKALSEPVRFGTAAGSHTARFGEIEQRGAALTRAGRALYDRLLAQGDPDAFKAFPDDCETLRRERLAFFRTVPAADMPLGAQSLDEAIRAGSVRAEPILYEDFLPVSAAGIFRSNLRGGSEAATEASPRRAEFEDALGCAVLDEFALYEKESAASAAALAL
jgi:2-oxoadipate dioxygenase/decarboxylase